MMRIDIIEASPDNANDILKIEIACFSTPWSESSILESLNNPCSHFYLAYSGGELAGYIGLQIFSGEGFVTNVATLPEYRRKGIAKSLIETALQNDMDFLTLEVRESNLPAIKLYKSLGFAEVGIRPKFYREPEEDALLMTKYLQRNIHNENTWN